MEGTGAMTLPISVCVPLQAKRRTIFQMMVLPSIRRNNPAEVLIDFDAGSANEKRNRAASDAIQPYLFFCDDDILLESYCLERLLHSLKRRLPTCSKLNQVSRESQLSQPTLESAL